MGKISGLILLLACLIPLVFVSGCTNMFIAGKIDKYTSGKIAEPSLSYNPPSYSFTAK